MTLLAFKKVPPCQRRNLQQNNFWLLCHSETTRNLIPVKSFYTIKFFLSKTYPGMRFLSTSRLKTVVVSLGMTTITDLQQPAAVGWKSWVTKLHFTICLPLSFMAGFLI